MDIHPFVEVPRLGPRIPMAEPEPIGRMDSILNFAMPDRVVEGRSAETSTSSSSASSSTGSCGANSCEKPTSSATFTLPIILGVLIPVVSALVLFVFLHRRHIKKQRFEDANDRHASLDFGLGDVPQPGRPRKAPGMASEMAYKEKGPRRHHQMSMDMDMTSPYLLPPELQNSRESLHSLSRTIHQHEDPYRQIQYHPEEVASIRSQSRQGRDGSSVYTGSSNPSRLQDLGTSDLLSNAGPMPKSNPPFIPPPRQNSLPTKNASLVVSMPVDPLSSRQNSLSAKNISPVESLSNDPLPPPPYPVEPPRAHLQDSVISRKGLPSNPRPGQGLAPTSPDNLDPRESYASNNDTGIRASQNYLGAFINERETSPPTPPSPPTKAPERELPNPNRKSPPVLNSLPANPRPVRKESVNVVQQQPQTFMDDQSEYGDGFQVTPPSPDRNAERMRGQRYSMDVPPEEFAQAGLGAPGFDPRRLSMGFRPLPPDAVTEVEDPETRANRIRSFYKEYFDESKPAPQGQYYEDYDENYLGDAAYFDPNANSFVMPYAQPVTRRAMTPPPRGPRFQGPPRGMHGSMGGMSTGGIRGPQMYPPGPFQPGPRAHSSASGRMASPGPRRPMPPPAALNTLPTPSKLRDDSFAIFNAMDFAPPQSYRDRAAGRSESPLGERRPYSPAVPSFVPTVSAFDDLAPMPSPHLLRRSGTFTALDFAPPKKFRDPDSMSDAGSIRSNRSGVSTAQLGAIRNGAYRVSRLPQDMVGTRDDLATALKPQWGMRPGN